MQVAEAEVLLAPEVDVVGVQKAVKAALVKAALVATPKLEGDVVQLVDVEEEVSLPCLCFIKQATFVLLQYLMLWLHSHLPCSLLVTPC